MLEYTPEVARTTAPLLERIKEFIPEVEWPLVAPHVYAINELKKLKNAVILAHNYQTPDIYHCVADFVGDSLQLAVQAQQTDADIIVQAGVHFMAESARIVARPEQRVFHPNLNSGCPMADMATKPTMVSTIGSIAMITMPPHEHALKVPYLPIPVGRCRVKRTSRTAQPISNTVTAIRAREINPVRRQAGPGSI